PGALGRLQVLAGQASSVHLLDPDSGRVAARAPHEGPVTCAQFDAGGRRLYTAGRDRAVKVWRLDVGLATPRDPGPAAADGRSTATLAADFAPDGTLLAEAIVNGPTLIPMKEVPAQQPPAVEPPPPPADAPPPPAAEPAATQPESGEPALPIDAVQAPPVPEVPPVPVRREPDFAAASTWRTVRVRHAGDVTSVGEWPVHAEVQSLRFSPDGGHVLAITQPFGFAYGLPTVVFRKEASFPVAFARISPPAVGSDDPEAPEAKRFALHLFPVGSPRGRTVAMPGPIAAAAIGPQGSQYAAATWGGRATLLDLAGGAATSFSYSGPLGVALDAGGDRAATVDWDHSVRIWGRKGQAMAPIARVENPGPVAGLRFSPDGSRLAIVINLGGPEGFMGLFHADRAGPSKARFRVVGTSGGDLVAERDAVNPTGDLQFSPDGSLLAIPSGPVVGKVFVWDLDGKSSIDHPGPVEARDRFPLVYDEASGRLVARPAGGPADRGNAYPYPIAFSPDGRYLAIVQDGLLGLNEARSGRIVAVKQSGDVGALRFSRVGSNLLAVGADGMSLRAWSVPDLRPVAWASMPHDRVTLAGFHPDGTGLIWVDGRQILQVRFHAVRQEFEELIKYRYIDELVDYLIKVRKSPGLPLTVDEITEAIIAHLTTPDDQGVRDKLKEMDLTPDLLDLKKGDVLLRRLIRLVIESKDPSLGSEKPVLLG
ncbi:MAG TPA: WD40 repeat domain-containing protein, partial [Isosphaeraceae bacterium]